MNTSLLNRVARQQRPLEVELGLEALGRADEGSLEVVVCRRHRLLGYICKVETGCRVDRL